MPLSELQLEVAEIVAGLGDAEDFALAGGAALVVLGIIERETRDLDYFAQRPAAVNRLRLPLERALQDRGLHVEVRRAVPGFVQYRVTSARDRTELDLSWDTRLHAAQRADIGMVLARDELAADKTLALFNRAEARDFVDVSRLRLIYSRDELTDLAREKDGGFDLAMFREAIRSIDRHARRNFPVDDATYEAILQEFADWQHEIQTTLQRPSRQHSLQPRTDQEPPGIDL